MILAYLFLLHFIADFILQSREMGKKKSTEAIWLLRHLLIQWIIFAVGLSFVIGPVSAILFATGNAVIHGVIDWNIWRLYKYSVAYRMLKNPDDVVFNSATAHDMAHFALEEGEKHVFVQLAASSWQYWEDHWFYTTIGLDQLLHALTLIFLAGVLCL